MSVPVKFFTDEEGKEMVLAESIKKGIKSPKVSRESVVKSLGR